MTRRPSSGRLRTVKVQQAAAQDEVEREVAREMAVRMRQVQRNMKGVKLQYTEAGRITFDDVAGIGDAKARPVPHGAWLGRRCLFAETAACFATRDVQYAEATMRRLTVQLQMFRQAAAS